jgi:hypothetical protein
VDLELLSGACGTENSGLNLRDTSKKKYK